MGISFKFAFTYIAANLIQLAYSTGMTLSVALVPRAQLRPRRHRKVPVANSSFVPWEHRFILLKKGVLRLHLNSTQKVVYIVNLVNMEQ